MASYVHASPDLLLCLTSRIYSHFVLMGSIYDFLLLRLEDKSLRTVYSLTSSSTPTHLHRCFSPFSSVGDYPLKFAFVAVVSVALHQFLLLLLVPSYWQCDFLIVRFDIADAYLNVMLMDNAIFVFICSLIYVKQTTNMGYIFLIFSVYIVCGIIWY